MLLLLLLPRAVFGGAPRGDIDPRAVFGAAPRGDSAPRALFGALPRAVLGACMAWPANGRARAGCRS